MFHIYSTTEFIKKKKPITNKTLPHPLPILHVQISKTHSSSAGVELHEVGRSGWVCIDLLV